MCIIFFQFNPSPNETPYQLILAANRDEFLNRPSRPAQPLEGHPNVICGLDLEPTNPGGTWIGVSKNGRIAAITNTSRATHDPKLQSRGELVMKFLTSEVSPKAYLEEIAQVGHKYNGFFLITIALRQDKIDGYIFCNKDDEGIRHISEGLHGLSNFAFNSNQTKIVYGKELIADAVKKSSSKGDLISSLLTALKDNKRNVPDPLHSYMYPELSSINVKLPTYGTRTHTIILVDHQQNVTFTEHTMQYPITENPKWIENCYEFRFQ
ncbi:Transport and Golgi organization protein 2-like protein [Trichoplax sp. H2]|uniref:Transport and Golgi organization protein 2 homolog n=1 Tax=Trichoplax adhaerens TaxID=10228 RepID=B3S6C5_TRIAD|nr:hypothetical protein TRIADDRAFT_59757 [Trichoplax adhaerens]EDV21599.1 hypothetical protein TRIADDRAFT_59757 [Trichoplax adhaerens]RDD47466.1 Transport and Golgi organization protein 2-like protein [Trichoplax sp. H2]|eukprot:XP_002115747.1 hypothetical protein TRIADDRAFT_59757 [Trichoplax adhaerens]